MSTKKAIYPGTPKILNYPEIYGFNNWMYSLFILNKKVGGQWLVHFLRTGWKRKYLMRLYHLYQKAFIKWREIIKFSLGFFYSLCNGGLPNNSGSNGNGQLSVVGNFSQPVSKGLNFREVLAYLVLITRGTREEKIKCKNYHAQISKIIIFNFLKTFFKSILNVSNFLLNT